MVELPAVVVGLRLTEFQPIRHTETGLSKVQFLLLGLHLFLKLRFQTLALTKKNQGVIIARPMTFLFLRSSKALFASSKT